MNWTTPQDIRERWIGSDVPGNDQLLRALIQDAEAIILREFPLIQTRVTANKLSASVITFVTSRMVTRVLKNPDNATFSSQTTGPFTSSKNVGDVDLWMTDDETDMLSPIISGKAFSIDLAPHAGLGRNYLLMTGNGYIEGAAYPPDINTQEYLNNLPNE